METSKTLRLKKTLSLEQQARLAYLFNPHKKREADNENTEQRKQGTAKAEVKKKLFAADGNKEEKK